MEILLLIGLIILNGVFAMSEIAIVTARRARLAKRAEEGDKQAATALKLAEEPTGFLSTVQIGITSIGILNGIVGEAVLADDFARWLTGLGADPETAAISATVMVVVAVTYLSIVVGELVPKRIGQLHPEGIARLMARPMQLLAFASRPFVALLSVSTKALLALLRVREDKADPLTEEEIHAVLAEGSDAGVIEAHEHAMVRNVLRLDDRQLGSLMVPRGEIDWIDLARPLAENLKVMTDSAHERFPVCEGGPANVLGFVQAKHVLGDVASGSADLRARIRPALYVPETLTGMELLERFRQGADHFALVVDEYGEIEGLITIHDLLEALTGDFAPAEGTGRAILRADGSWLLDGSLPLPDLKDCLGIRLVPEEGRYHTLSGMILRLLGRIPEEGDTAVWEAWHFEVMDMDGKRIDKVLALPVASVGDGIYVDAKDPVM
ncbi:hemolysin family protein [Gimibacter soli]|uniref:Hemolysin family protein n=1 Tax=Gimibacter soli TaxID=3024400 RepID=A0AAE9XT28_9PROT|nr:hemolysin family protein [Gimibacter soli]WCL53615.1 hemolysin family protein [Gimibacter soli]